MKVVDCGETQTSDDNFVTVSLEKTAFSSRLSQSGFHVNAPGTVI